MSKCQNAEPKLKFRIPNEYLALVTYFFAKLTRPLRPQENVKSRQGNAEHFRAIIPIASAAGTLFTNCETFRGPK